MKELLRRLFRGTPLHARYVAWRIDRQYAEEVRRNRRVRGPLVREFIPPGGVGAELGVLQGNFSRVLLESSRARRLHLIDPWYLLTPEWPWAGGNPSTVDALIKVLGENREEIREGRVVVHVRDDLDALEDFDDGYLDWAYVDSSHAYEHTRAELALLARKVRTGGIICGDDWRPDPAHRHHGVCRAVREFVAEHGTRILYADEHDLQWFVRAP